jgi:predicted nucleotidyltransferase
MSTSYEDVETYRRDVLASVRSLGDYYRRKATDALNVEVGEVWVHGSVLDPDEFDEDSDVDIAIVVNMPDEPDGLLEFMSSELAGTFPDGISGVVDVIVLNRTRPYGRDVAPIRIA